MSDDRKGKGAFPSRLPLEKPTDRPLSAAMQRVWDRWTPKQDIGNPFYTVFKYSPVTGIGRDESDLSVSRRDPSKVLKIGDTYYVWYTRRRTQHKPVGRFNIDQGDDEHASRRLGPGGHLLRHLQRWLQLGGAGRGRAARAQRQLRRSLAFNPRHPRLWRALLSLLSVLHDDVAPERLRQRQHGLVGFARWTMDALGTPGGGARRGRRMGQLRHSRSLSAGSTRARFGFITKARRPINRRAICGLPKASPSRSSLKAHTSNRN